MLCNNLLITKPVTQTQTRYKHKPTKPVKQSKPIYSVKKMGYSSNFSELFSLRNMQKYPIFII